MPYRGSAQWPGREGVRQLSKGTADRKWHFICITAVPSSPFKGPDMDLGPDALTAARDNFQVKFYPVDRKCAHSFAQLVSLSFYAHFHPAGMRQEG